MMTITTILGSPRKHGNTAAVLGMFERLMSEKYSVKRITIPRKAVNGCLGCDACQRKMDVPGCVQKDEISGILEKILVSDIVVYASPVYVWDFTAQMKALMDRHYCFVKWKRVAKVHSLVAGKPAMLLATCGGDAGDNADLIQEIFKREMSYIQCSLGGCYIVANCTKPAELGTVAAAAVKRMAAAVQTLQQEEG
jgi:multimeric flavodoxin WrbA